MPGFAGIDTGSRTGPAFGDLDADGDLDMIGSGWAQDRPPIRYYENIGTASQPRFVSADGNLWSALPADPWNLSHGLFPELADIDDDGDLDLVVGTRTESNGQRTYFTVFLENVGTPSAPQFVERLDGDNPFGAVNAGFSEFTSGRPSVNLVDLDGDSDLDMAVGTRNVGFEDPLLRFYRNDGSPSVPSFTYVESGALNDLGIHTWSSGSFTDHFSAASFGDLDGDLDQDIVLYTLGMDEREGLEYWRNTGTAQAPAFTQITGGENPFDSLGAHPTGIHGHKLVDIDDDGDLDWVVGRWDGTFKLFRNVGTPTAPAMVREPDATDPFGGAPGVDAGETRAAVGDLDGDGDLDAVVTKYTGNIQFFRAQGSGSSVAFEPWGSDLIPGNPAGGYVAPYFGDLDDDGDLDLIFGNFQGQVQYWENGGTPQVPSFTLPTDLVNLSNSCGSPPFSSKPLLADFDGDLDLDLHVVSSRGDGKVRCSDYFRNDGTKAVPVFVKVESAQDPLAGIFAARYHSVLDVDGDGDLDLFSSQGSDSFPGTGREFRFYRNVGTVNSASFVEEPSSNWFQRMNSSYDIPNSAHLGDFDQDGDVDMLVGGDADLAYVQSYFADVFADGFESGDTSRWSTVQ